LAGIVECHALANNGLLMLSLLLWNRQVLEYQRCVGTLDTQDGLEEAVPTLTGCLFHIGIQGGEAQIIQSDESTSGLIEEVQVGHHQVLPRLFHPR
jgi:hypothetical protein